MIMNNNSCSTTTLTDHQQHLPLFLQNRQWHNLLTDTVHMPGEQIPAKTAVIVTQSITVSQVKWENENRCLTSHSPIQADKADHLTTIVTIYIYIDIVSIVIYMFVGCVEQAINKSTMKQINMRHST